MQISKFSPETVAIEKAYRALNPARDYLSADAEARILYYLAHRLGVIVRLRELVNGR